MTCIVGLVQNNRLIIGGDCAGSYDQDIRARRDVKVFHNGPFLMGFTSSFRMGQLLHWSLKPPKHPKRMPDDKFMSTVFVDAVRKCLTTGGYATKRSEAEYGGTFIIGYRRRLFVMESDYQIGQYHDDCEAIGSGERVAMGCLYGTQEMKDPRKRVELALIAAERYTTTVRGPFTILEQT